MELDTDHRSAPRTARAMARAELTRDIVDSARKQLGVVGPAQLSVRAVARDLGMASSAVYRYFPSRDHLLTALLESGYNELGSVVEEADSAVVDRNDHLLRWLTLGRCVRGWAVARPYDYALLFGSPVPGYDAPQSTIQPATRVTGVLAVLMRDIAAAGAVQQPTVPAAVHRSITGMHEFIGTEVDDALVMAGAAAWSGLIGAISLELFGHLVNAVSDHDAYFEQLLHVLAPTDDRLATH
jgi:AcrR family transcriptional regulator